MRQILASLSMPARRYRAFAACLSAPLRAERRRPAAEYSRWNSGNLRRRLCVSLNRPGLRRRAARQLPSPHPRQQSLKHPCRQHPDHDAHSARTYRLLPAMAFAGDPLAQSGRVPLFAHLFGIRGAGDCHSRPHEGCGPRRVEGLALPSIHQGRTGSGSASCKSCSTGNTFSPRTITIRGAVA